MRLTAPSVRNSASSRRRAPSPRRGERRLQPRGEPLDGREHVLLARDRLGKLLLGDIGRDRQERGERLVLAAERAVELAQELGAETGGERRARQIEDVADAFEADARQRGDGLGRQPQRRERQRREQRRARRRYAGDAVTGIARSGAARPGGADGRGDGGARCKAETRHAGEEIVAQLRFAAEQMGAAADVEQNAVGRIGGDERRVALAPVGDGIEQARVGGCILRHGDERGMHGARLRQRKASAQAEPFRRGVDRDEQSTLPRLPETTRGRGSLTPTAARCGRSKAARATGSECAARTKRCSTLFHSTIQVPR